MWSSAEGTGEPDDLVQEWGLIMNSLTFASRRAALVGVAFARPLLKGTALAGKDAGAPGGCRRRPPVGRLSKRTGNKLELAILVLWWLMGFPNSLGIAGEATNAVKPDLLVTVYNEGAEPLTNAMAFIYSAKPRLGPSFANPTSYPDCRKRARANARGQLKIESVDSNLLFRVLVAAPGRQPVFVELVDAERGPLDVNLMPVNQPELLPHKFLRGRVVDPRGQPVAPAIVSFQFYFGEEANRGGQVPGVDMWAATDTEGRFVITADKRFDVMSVTVEAPGFAPRRFLRLSNDREQELKITQGATVTGRVVQEGKPLEGVTVAMASADRAVDYYLGDFIAGTDAQGRFWLFNLPSYHIFQLYGKSGSLGGLGIIPPRKVRVAADESTEDVGDLAVVSGVRLSGRLRLSDQQPVPPAIPVVLATEEANDSQTVLAGDDGTFRFTNAPACVVSLVVKLPGYHLSARNRSLDRLNPYHLIGRIEKDVEALEILLEPGQYVRPKREEFDEIARGFRPDQHILSGAEARN